MSDDAEAFTGDPASVQADIAFLRTVLDERARGWRRAGILFTAGGLAYGGEALVGVIDLLGPVRLPPVTQLVAAIAASGGFLAVLFTVLIRDRRHPGRSGVASRAMNGAFTGFGLANAAAAVPIAAAAIRLHDLTVWLLFPAASAAFIGAAWFAVASVTRRAWMRLVSLGWLAAGIALGLALPSIAAYLVVATIALFALMVAPGVAMMRMGDERD